MVKLILTIQKTASNSVFFGPASQEVRNIAIEAIGTPENAVKEVYDTLEFIIPKEGSIEIAKKETSGKTVRETD